jgi:hypothetical protein
MLGAPANTPLPRSDKLADLIKSAEMRARGLKLSLDGLPEKAKLDAAFEQLGESARASVIERIEAARAKYEAASQAYAEAKDAAEGLVWIESRHRQAAKKGDPEAIAEAALIGARSKTFKEKQHAWESFRKLKDSRKEDIKLAQSAAWASASFDYDSQRARLQGESLRADRISTEAQSACAALAARGAQRRHAKKLLKAARSAGMAGPEAIAILERKVKKLELIKGERAKAAQQASEAAMAAELAAQALAQAEAERRRLREEAWAIRAAEQEMQAAAYHHQRDTGG